MRIGIVGAIATENVKQHLAGDVERLPKGYYGAPILSSLIDELLIRGHFVSAFTTSPDMEKSTCITSENGNFKITYCASRKRAFRYSEGQVGRAADAFKIERKLLGSAIRGDKLDIVHAHWTYEFAMAAMDSEKPYLITCHDAPQVILRYSPDLYRLVRYFMGLHVLKRAKHITAVSPYLKQLISRYACNTDIEIVPNPLPRKFEVISRKRYFNTAEPKVVMLLNGWGRRKNAHMAIEGFSKLLKKIPGAHMYAMGADYEVDGKAYEWTKRNNYEKNIHYIGSQTHEEVLQHLHSADILLHPSLEETFGMSVAEAMCVGLPVIAGVNSGAVPWVVGDYGVLTDVTSSDMISNAMLHLLQNRDKLQFISRNSPKNIISRFGVSAVVDLYEDQYQRVIGIEKNILNRKSI
jgi:L-malate glycosyltransferase